MKHYIYIFLVVILVSCTRSNFDFNEYNQYGDIHRVNDYSILGDLNNTIINTTKISINDFSGCYKTPLYLGDNTYAIATTNGAVNLIKNDSINWTYNIEDKLNLLTNIVADYFQNLYFVDYNGNLISIDKNGKKRFKISINQGNSRYFSVSEPLIIGNQLIIGTNEGNLYKYDTNGILKWTKKYPLTINSVFAADNNDNIYIGLTNNLFNMTDTLLVLNKNGKELSKQSLDNIRILSPIITNDGKIYLAGGIRTNNEIHSEILCFNNNLKLIWKKNVPIMINQLSHNGQFLIAGGFSSGINEYKTGIYSFDLNGKEMWKNYLDVKISSPLLLSKNNITFTATNENGAGIFILSISDGELIKSHSLSNITPLYLVPTVNENKDLILFGSQTLFLIKLTKTPLEKILPY